MITACVGDPGSAASQTEGDEGDDGETTGDDTHAGSLSHGSTLPSTTDDGPSPATTLNVFPGATDPGDDGIDEVGEEAGSEVGESTIGSEPSTTSTAVASSSEGPIAVPVCGNGVLEDSEQCDDGGNDGGDFCGSTCQFESRAFGYIGAPVAIMIPDWMSTMSVQAWGAEGGGSQCCDGTLQDDGGRGGWATGIYDVVSGGTVTVYVGGKGVRSATGGFNGGGAGGLRGGGGGGASDVRTGFATLDDRIIVAGGGGGGSCGCFETG
ncbi:MAG: hypothetical protein IAG13_29080, partial [Deltaproteobacteria bacterium]|nr:hypothetical protein [Nannocystaceae bacterium]